MNKQLTPEFRKAINGYKKEDVNSYIINMSKKYAESEIQYKNEIARLKLELQNISKTNDELLKKAEKSSSENLAEIFELEDKIKSLNKALEDKNAEYNALVSNMQKTDTNSKLSDSFGGITDENEKAMLFDCISSKTGEIMVIACKTADDIIAEAKKEAEEIVNEANSKKDTMLRTISGSADSMTSDISAYIKNAVDGCLNKIYSSIKSVDSESK